MNSNTKKSWTAEELLQLGRAYQQTAVFVAAAELDLFSVLAPAPRSAAALAGQLHCDGRALIVLLDALVAIGFLDKTEDVYSLPAGLANFLTSDGRRTLLAMVQHQANCLRRWARLAEVVKTGQPITRAPSVRGPTGDIASFIGAMANISAPVADEVIQAIQPLTFQRLLDIGGASGTWTQAFLRACPTGSATLFDLPTVIPLAQRALATAALTDRVQCVPGDFTSDPLPNGVDLAWLSAIVHQNSRDQNRALFGKVFHALVPGGRLAIRDILMEEKRTSPVAGALFAVNMLVATEGGGTFTFSELREDLATAGFVEAKVARRDEGMQSIVIATKPAQA